MEEAPELGWGRAPGESMAPQSRRDEASLSAQHQKSVLDERRIPRHQDDRLFPSDPGPARKPRFWPF